MSKRTKAVSLLWVMTHAAVMGQPLPEAPSAATVEPMTNAMPGAASAVDAAPDAAPAPAVEAAPRPIPASTADAAAAPVEPPADHAAAPEAAAAPPSASTPGKVRFERANYKPGIESLRLVARSTTGGNIALQVGLAVGLSLLGGGGFAIGGSAFSKDDLGGSAVPDLTDPALIANPATTELIAALEQEVAQADARRLSDGQPVPTDEVRLVVNPGPWKLVYETLLEGEETFRLKWGATVVKKGSMGLFRNPVRSSCQYQSAESVPLASWRANDWQRLRDERTRAFQDCLRVLQPQLPDLI